MKRSNSFSCIKCSVKAPTVSMLCLQSVGSHFFADDSFMFCDRYTQKRYWPLTRVINWRKGTRRKTWFIHLQKADLIRSVNVSLCIRPNITQIVAIFSQYGANWREQRMAVRDGLGWGTKFETHSTTTASTSNVKHVIYLCANYWSFPFRPFKGQAETLARKQLWRNSWIASRTRRREQFLTYRVGKEGWQADSSCTIVQRLVHSTNNSSGVISQIEWLSSMHSPPCYIGRRILLRWRKILKARLHKLLD